MKTILLLAVAVAFLTSGCGISRTERSFSIGNRGWNYSRGTDVQVYEQWVPNGRNTTVRENTYENYNEWNYGPTYHIPQVIYVQPVVPPPVYWPGRR